MSQPRFPHDPRPEVRYEVSYPPPAPRVPGPVPPSSYGTPYGASYGARPASAARSRAPLGIAALAVLALAVGLTVLLLLRSPARVSGTGAAATTGGASAAEQVTAEFFAAVDEKDEGAMKDRGRGDILEDIEMIVDGEPVPDGLHFAEGSATESTTAAVDGVRIAAVAWELDDPPEGITDDATLTVRLLDDGDGYRICDIDGSGSASVAGVLKGFENEYEDICDYQK
ncbi:hypothetical protein [Cumulibacter manganitolerans]|uniref:hypothetical protein n=1 Tax=Cumulibacter manganitolerans TaxID=1884992 RepID=UPI0012972DFC|nr:hypothetical protein [Cumulibacter manganitolerans]